MRDVPWTPAFFLTMQRLVPALAYILAGLALQTAWRHAPGSPGERRLLAAVVVALFVVTTAVGLFTPKNRFYFSATDYHVKAKHARTEDRLRHEPGDHLVLVQYGPRHDPWEELVYNAADIDGSRIIWARSVGSQKDSELIRYYSKRTAWLLEEDSAVKLKRYLASTESTTPPLILSEFALVEFRFVLSASTDLTVPGSDDNLLIATEEILRRERRFK